MRIPNLNVSSNVTNTIRELDQQRFTLDRQISTGQKITYPEDDGIRTGRLIQTDALKAKLAQYQRNASYASEFLNAGHLNLDHLQKLNQRAQEISRVAGSQINKSAAETYGHEIEQLVEEALNRINARHRGRSLYGGTEHKPNFGSSEVVVGLEHKKTISLNKSLVGSYEQSGNRVMQASESLVFKLNGREYVIEVIKDGLTTDEALQIVRDLVNSDKKDLGQSPKDEGSNYRAFVRGGEGENEGRNDNANLRAEISSNGELVISGVANESYYASVDFFTQWNPNTYFPEQVDAKISAQTELSFPGKKFDDLSEQEQESIRRQVFQTGTTSFSKAQFELMLDSNAVIKFREEYDTRALQANPPQSPSLNGFSDLDPDDQDEIFAETYRHFFNSGDLVFELTDAEVLAFTGESGKGGSYAFDYKQKLDDPLYPMTLYLKPMELGTDGVWGASSDQASTDLEVTDDNFYELVNRNDQEIREVDNAKVDSYVISEQLIPVGAAPVMSWVRDVAVDSNVLPGSSSFETIHSSQWKRLQTFDLGDVVEFDGKFWESQIPNNTNHIPASLRDSFWKELPSNYSAEREDWEFEARVVKQRFFYMAPDGQMFESDEEALNYTENLLLNSSNFLYSDRKDLEEDKQSLVREVKYAVTDLPCRGPHPMLQLLLIPKPFNTHCQQHSRVMI